MAEEVSVPVSIIEEIRDTVTSAQYHSQTVDLAESYRKLQSTPKWSKMTVKLINAGELLQSFIEIAQSEEEPDESGGETE